MSTAGFRGRGPSPRGRNVRGLPSGVVGARIPQPNFHQRRREGHGPPTEFWLDHQPPGVPWQQMNGLPPPQAQQYPGFESHRYRGGRPQFCPSLAARGRGKRIRGEGRPRSGILPTHEFTGMGMSRPEPEPLRFPPLGSEEERQQKIAETADRLKQKLSSLNIEEPVHFWEDDLIDVSFAQEDGPVVGNRGIPELRHDPPELNLTVNDFKDIGRVDPESCINSAEPSEVVALENSKSKVQRVEGDLDNEKIWHLSDHRHQTNSEEDITELLNEDKIPQNPGIDKETSAGQRVPNSSKNDPQSEEDKLKSNEASFFARMMSEEQLPNRVERAALKAIEKKNNSDLKPELSKSLQKLREVIKVDRELENERKSSRVESPESRTIFQPNAQPRHQPNVRSDFHQGMGSTYQRFQEYSHGGTPREIGNRLRGHPMEIHPNFAPEFQQRFDPDPREYNVPRRPPSPRMMYSEFGGPMPQRMQHRNSDMPRGFDPWEPPPRFPGPPRQDHLENSSWFNRNELPPKFGPQNTLNGIQPPPGFQGRAPPERFMSQNHEMNVYRPNVIPNSDFPGIVPIGYPQVPHIPIRHQPGYFNPVVPPPNTAPCIIHKFPTHSVPPSPGVESRLAMRPPPIPMGVLNLQPPSPPELSRELDDPCPSDNQNPTPDMDAELADMQKALEFAQKFSMNMSEEEVEVVQPFEMPTFPDLPPIPSTEPSHLAEKPTESEPEISLDPTTQDEICLEIGPQNCPDESTEGDDSGSIQKYKSQENLPEYQTRARVTFNLNSKGKKISPVEEWKNQNAGRTSKDKAINVPTSESRSEERSPSESKLQENKNNRKNRLQIREDVQLRGSQRFGENSSQKESGIDIMVEIGSKTPDDNSKGRASSSKTGPKTLSASVVDANWKDKVINQFLKMSKNDICNMVNSSGLRKFDIAMKHLVKERKYSLSQERRCSADDAVKGGTYDMSREEFMSQLSAMLDPSATVDLQNLPSKFIQHLSEVLKLDVQSHLNDAADAADAAQANNSIDELGNVASIEEENDYFAHCEQQRLHFFANMDDRISPPTENLPEIVTIGDVSSSGIARTREGQKSPPQGGAGDSNKEIEGEFITHGLIRPRCTKTLMSMENLGPGDTFSPDLETPNRTVLKNAESEIGDFSEERIDGTDGWEGKKGQGPDVFGSSTKGELEAKCTRSMDSFSEKETRIRSRTPSSRETSLSAPTYSPRNIDRSSKRYRSKNLSTPSPTRENNYNLNIVVHTTNDAVDQWSKATEDELLAEGDSDGPVSSCASISSKSDYSNSSNVTKLLKVIKEREKMAKDMSLSEAMREEIAAEIESNKVKQRENEIDRRCRKREKNKRKKERRNRRKLQGTKSTGLEIENETRIPLISNSVKQEAFIKQEELIIEADNDRFSETSNQLAAPDQAKNPNSHSTLETNEEMLSETVFQENSRFLATPDCTLNTQEMLVAQEYANQSTTLELRTESSQDSHQPSAAGKEDSAIDARIKSSVHVETPLEKSEAKETRKASRNAAETQKNKSGAKKIDIEAYKARKLQRNTEKQNKSKESEARSDTPNIKTSDVQCSTQEAQHSVKETQKETNTSTDLKRNRNEDKCEKRNPVDNFKSGSTKDAAIDAKDSSVPPAPHKEKITATTRVKHDRRRDKREEKKPSKETSMNSDRKNEKARSHETFNKNRSRPHSRNSKRSTSHENDRRNIRDRFEHSSRERRHNTVRSASLDKSQLKATHQNNNIVHLRDRKTTRYEAYNSPSESHEKIERPHSRSKKNFTEKRSRHRRAERRNDLRQQSPDLIRHKVGIDKEKDQKDKVGIDKEEDQKEDIAISQNFDQSKETVSVGQTSAGISTGVAESAEVSGESPEMISTEPNTYEKSGAATPNDTQNPDHVSPSISQDDETPLIGSEEPTAELASETVDPENEFHAENMQEDAEKDASDKQDQPILNEEKESATPDEEILESRILIDGENELASEFHQNETLVKSDFLESTERSSGHEAEQTLDIANDFELGQSCENDIKTVLNDLIDRAISQLDLLNNKNEAKETPAETGAVEELEAKETPVETGAVEELEAKETPVETGAVEELEAKETPVETGAVEELEAEETPVETGAVEELEAKETSVETGAVEKLEAKETPVETGAVEEPEFCREDDASLEPRSLIEHQEEFQVSSENVTLEISSPRSPESPLKGFSDEVIRSSILGKRRLVESVFEITEDFMINKRSKNFDNTILDMVAEDANATTDQRDPIPDQNTAEFNLGARRTETEVGYGHENDVSPMESEPKTVDQNDEDCIRCVTPSGDTLSLGSSIDFDNNEFIVLSEISSDEDFSQDENRKRESLPISESDKPVDSAKPKNKEKSREKDSGSNIDELSQDETQMNHESTTSRQSPSIITLKSSNDTELTMFHSELQTEDKNSRNSSPMPDNAKLSASENVTQSSELECNLRCDNSKEKTDDTVNEDPVVNVFKESQGKSIEQSETVHSEGAGNLDKLKGNEGSRSTQKKASAVEEDNSRKKISEFKKSSKSDEAKRVKEVSSKDVTSSGNRTSKNLHRVKHRHRMKHKKEKKFKLDEKTIKEAVREGDLVTVVKKQHTRESVMARMVEIDLEVHKLMSEKMKLYAMLKGGELPSEPIDLAAAKDGPEPLLEIINAARKNPDPLPSNNETHASFSSTKQKHCTSKNTTEPHHSKSTKITATCALKDDAGNRHSGNQKDTSFRKSKKSHRHERPAKPDGTVQTESKKLSGDKAVDAKSTTSRREKNIEEKSASKRDSHSRSSSRSSRQKEGETLRKEEQTRKNPGPAKEALDEDVISQKSKKTDHHSGQKKKTNKISHPKDDPLPKGKNEEQLCSEIELRSRNVAESVNVATEKRSLQIYSDESSQLSVSQEYEGNKKATKGLALLEESYKREKAASRKRKAGLFRVKKEGLKSPQKSGTSLTVCEEEMPLNLLYVKKLQNKKDSPDDTKSKATMSTEVPDHVLEVINAVVENKLEEYHRSSRVKTKTVATVHVEEPNPNRKAKLTSKSKLDPDRPNCAIEESRDVLPAEDLPDIKTLYENIPDDDLRDSKDLDDTENIISTKLAASPREMDSKFPIEKIIEISTEKNGAQITRNRSRAKRSGSRGEAERLSLFENVNAKEINQTVEHRRCSSEDVLRGNPLESNTLNYLNVVPQFEDHESNFMAQDPTVHGHSISHNIEDIEKGLDVLDSMLETVSSDLEVISAKPTPSSSAKRSRRKRKSSGVESVVLSKKMKIINRPEMMDCSVKLVDCKYTYLRNCFNRSAGQRFTILPPEETDNHLQLDVDSWEIQYAAESCTHVAESRSPVLLQRTPSGESRDWLLEGNDLIDDVENLPPLNTEHYFTTDCDLGLHQIEGNSEYDVNDLEIMKLNRSSLAAEDVGDGLCPETAIPEVGDWQSLDKIGADNFGSPEFGVQTMAELDSEIMSPEISVLEENTELAVHSEPHSRLIDLEEACQEAQIAEADLTKETESDCLLVMGGERAAVECGENSEILVPSQDQETNDIQELELPRIQYSVHKGPILDVKVFGDSILAASEDGVIYRYSQTCNGILNTYEGHKSAVTCIYILQSSGAQGISTALLFSGSLDGSLRCFDIMSGHQVRGAADVGSPIQCMDQSWGEIFLGTKSGYVFRFHIKSHTFKGDEIKFSEESVLALKATTEGPRKVLIVASRSQPITIRDAQTGLFLRTVSGHKSHTVYSLMMDSNLVYCGTSSTAIPVFDFINGSEVKLYNAGTGIVCMRMYKWLLFAGCYDGNIYVFDTKEQGLVCSIPGPGNMLLSMDIVKNKIVAGSKDRRLHMWQMPEQVVSLLAKRT